ncbi:MAG: hypothetical protein U0223_06480 [Nitrospira sp.]|nr:hypothetical protein [Nitrospira sp.]
MIPSIRCIVGAFVVVLATVIEMYPAHAGTLEDYINTIGKTGCESIPYAGLQRSCQNLDVDKYCKDASQYPRASQGTRALRQKIDTDLPNEIKKLESGVKSLQEAVAKATSEAEKQSINANIRTMETDLNNRYKTLSQMNGDLQTDIATIDKRIQNGERCSRERYDMFQVFKAVISKAESETDPAVVKEATPRLAYWKSQQDIHYRVRIEDVQVAIEKCKDCRDGKQ